MKPYVYEVDQGFACVYLLDPTGFEKYKITPLYSEDQIKENRYENFTKYIDINDNLYTVTEAMYIWQKDLNELEKLRLIVADVKRHLDQCEDGVCKFIKERIADFERLPNARDHRAGETSPRRAKMTINPGSGASTCWADAQSAKENP